MMFAPKSMPKDVVQKVNAAVNKAIADPELAQRLGGAGRGVRRRPGQERREVPGERGRPLGQDHQGGQHQGRVAVDAPLRRAFALGHEARLRAAHRRRARAAVEDLALGAEVRHRGRDGAVPARQPGARHPRLRLHQEPAARRGGAAARLRARRCRRAYPDAIFGHWLQIDPRLGEAGAAELERCIRASRRLHRLLRVGLRHGLHRRPRHLRPVLRGPEALPASRCSCWSDTPAPARDCPAAAG